METSHLRLLGLSLLLLGGCGGGEQLILPGDGQPAAINVVDGDGQSGVVGEPLANPVIVEVSDSRGRPVEGVPVAFEFGTAGAGANVIPQTAETNSEGRAEAQLVLGTAIGRQTGRARVVTDEGRQPVTATFSATALSESANRLQAVAGQDQTGHVGQPLDDRLVVEVTDGFGNPVPGVTIDWSVEGGGSVSEATVLTGEDGRARVERILGPAVGSQSTVATSEGLAGSPVVFAHTAIAGNASRLVIESGNDQTAAAGAAVPNELVVRLVDADGNGVPGAGLSWVVATGGGSASPVNTATDGNGRASTQWTLGGTLGEQRIDAVVSGVGFISFRATATAGAPAALFISTQPSGSARNATPFDRQPVIQLRDARGNPAAVAGIQVRAGLGSGGGELLGTLVRSTDANGRAVFTDLAIAGDAGTRTLFFSAEGYAGVSSNPIVVGPPANRSPSASFTVNCQNLSCSFIDGSSDPDGTIVSYSWSFGDGGSDAQRNPSHTYPGAGTYQVALTVTDNDGATGSAAQTITVNGAPPPQNRAPDADFNWFCPSLTCDFTDASGDSDGSIVQRVWNWGDGTSTDNVLNPSHTYSAPGVYHVTLTVTDNGGLTDLAEDNVDPPPPNQPPTAAFTAQCDELKCDFENQSDDPDGRIETRLWDFGDGSTSDERSPEHEYAAGGTYTVRLTVTDNDGASSSVEHPVTVAAPNQRPNAEFSWSCADLNCQFTDQSTDGDGAVVSWGWDFDDGGGSSDQNPVHAFPAAGTYNVRLTATDNAGATHTTVHGVSVTAPPPPNQAPTAAFSAPSCTTGQACQFSAAGSQDPDGSITTYTWDFGDGIIEGGPEAGREHTYATASAEGQYQVTLTVTDNDGATGSVTHQVTVTDPPPPPAPVLNLRPGLTISP